MMYMKFIIYFEVYFKTFIYIFNKFYPIFLILFILYNIDCSVICCEGEIDNFDKLSQEDNSKNNYKILNPFIDIGKGLKKGFNKFVSKIKELDQRLEEWDRKKQIKYQKEWEIYEESRNRRLKMKIYRNYEKYKNRYNFYKDK